MKPNFSLKKHVQLPSNKTLIIVGCAIAFVISILIVVRLANPFGMFGGSSNLGLKVVDMNVAGVITDYSLDEDANISDDAHEAIYNNLAQYAANENEEERITNIHSYFYALIQDALKNGHSDFAMVLLFQEYDYFIGIGNEEAALGALLSFDTSKVEQRQQNNVNRMIAETAERLGKTELSQEYANKITEENE